MFKQIPPKKYLDDAESHYYHNPQSKCAGQLAQTGPLISPSDTREVGAGLKTCEASLHSADGTGEDQVTLKIHQVSHPKKSSSD